MNIGILCAAGKGARLKNKKPKALILINKKPIFIYTLDNLFKGHLDKILILAPKNCLKKINYYLKRFYSTTRQKKIIAVIPGGKERQDSIQNGLNYLKEKASENDNILIHNAANVFITAWEVKKIIRELNKGFAAAIALPSVDTIREVSSKGDPISQLDRKKIWRMQTPQGAKLKTLLSAYQKAFQENYYGTDDLELIIKNRGSAKIVQGNPLNFKITYPEDLKITKVILENKMFKP